MILQNHYAFQYFCIKLMYRLLLVILFFTSQYKPSPSVRNILLIKFDNKVNLYFEEQYSFESFRKQNKKLRAKRGGPNTLKILVLSKQTCSVRITTKTIQKRIVSIKVKGALTMIQGQRISYIIFYYGATLIRVKQHILFCQFSIPIQIYGCLLYTSPSPRDS